MADWDTSLLEVLLTCYVWLAKLYTVSVCLSVIAFTAERIGIFKTDFLLDVYSDLVEIFIS